VKALAGQTTRATEVTWPVPCAASPTLRAISCVAAPCCSITAATEVAVLEAALSLSRHSDGLTREVGGFLAAVKAA
jgi:hypothetical protein